MSIFDITLAFSIVIVYNIFVHILASISFKDEQFEEKQKNTTLMLIIFGVVGIVASILLFEQYYSNKIVSNGLFYGGIILIITAILANWSNISTIMKLALAGLALGLLIWYSFKVQDSPLIETK